MNDKAHISIAALVSENERAAVQLATGHLARAVSQAAGTPWTCDCVFAADLAALQQNVDAAIVVTSFLPELENVAEPWAEVENRLRTTYAALCERGTPVFICTVLRHIGHDVDAETADALMVRIRRLDLLAAEISRESGAFVIDFDRVLADVGARRLQTDYRLGGNAAAEMAGHFLASTVLGNAPEELVSFELQDAARDILDGSGPAVAASEAAKSTAKKLELRAVGQGRRKQVVVSVVHTERDVYAGWFMRQVLRGKIGPGEVAQRLLRAVRQHGVLGSGKLIGAALSKQLQRKK
jgi:hypothetical protein